MVYLNQPKEKIAATAALIRHFRAFLASDCDRMCDPYDDFGGTLDKAQARRRLHYLVNVAINRKAGLPDSRGRKDTHEYQTGLIRDRNRIHDKVRQRIIFRQLETPELRGRFGHLATDLDDF